MMKSRSCLRDGNQADVVKQTGHITVRCLGKAVDSNGNIIRRSAVRHPTGLARKMDTLYEEEENAAREEIHAGGQDTFDVNKHNGNSPSLSFNRQLWGTQHENATSNEDDGNSAEFAPQSVLSRCTREVNSLKSPIQVLKELAYNSNVMVEYSTVEYDPGDLNLPTYFECALQAGSYNVKGRSTIKKLAQLLAAQEYLDLLKNHHPTVQIPDWKRAVPLNPMMDPVHLLSQHCKIYQLPLPTYAFTSMTNTKLYECKCFWKKFYTDGQASSKSVAQRRAAFEMFDCIMNERGGNNMTYSAPVINHISVDPKDAKSIREGLLPKDDLPTVPLPFKVERVNQGPPHPEIKMRYGYDAKAIDGQRSRQFSAEYQATFRSTGDTAAEAMLNCVKNAHCHTKDMSEYFKGVAVRKIQELKTATVKS
ncbi:unnamed protein product [Allacma fusca]|uniref:DRBM domain-containing protein n=1 Tax=Allacma fusca TaxID=39272 RepID=A0A8J2PRQ5_9HEXA|nr:unnamed protein product [Allacma fusca]